ncbi:hypothetical protein AWH56_004170 [Anaerobacillus isosaccharinicus]|uniref:PsbP C-terminal domain-containing protein n=1 Tax=Anaerobacillus isosaccharinicus TaxID=1532552 RepID=A0A7S7RCE4_9BACI|nr:hypothetical protein [Anaerobacillus isosaccharinicus]
MGQKAVHILLMMLLLVVVGCSKATEEVTDASQLDTDAYFYDNKERGIRIEAANEWFIEKETVNSVKLKSEKLVAIISVIPKGKTVSEIKRELMASAGDVTLKGEGLNFISWKSEREESILTNVWVEEKPERNVIVTIMTPYEIYENNKEKIEAFRESIKLY